MMVGTKVENKYTFLLSLNHFLLMNNNNLDTYSFEYTLSVIFFQNQAYWLLNIVIVHFFSLMLHLNKNNF